MGSTLIGSRAGIIETSLHLLLQVPHYIPEQKKFELGVLVIHIFKSVVTHLIMRKLQIIFSAW
jgi:hypothetical protein